MEVSPFEVGWRIGSGPDPPVDSIPTFVYVSVPLGHQICSWGHGSDLILTSLSIPSFFLSIPPSFLLSLLHSLPLSVVYLDGKWKRNTSD